MISNMHCRPLYPNNDSTCSSSFLFNHPKYTDTLNAPTRSTSSYNDQKPPPPAPRHRRRLDDPVLTYASNYYVTYPRQTSHSPLELSPLPSLRQIYPQSESNGIYCDLFNLLECPPPIKQRKKYLSNEYSPHRRRHRSVDYARAHAKMKDSNQRKRHYQQPSYYKENKHHQLDKLSSIQQYDQIQDKAKNTNNIYQRHLPSQGFFRRVARHYFCMPMTVNDDDFSS